MTNTVSVAGLDMKVYCFGTITSLSQSGKPFLCQEHCIYGFRHIIISYQGVKKKGDSALIVPRLYEDMSVLHQNAMPDRAYYVPFSTRSTVQPWQRTDSDRLQMLSGCDWLFSWYPSIHDMTEAFYLPSYKPGSEWKKENVPFSWQMRGYDSPQYTNIRYPFPFDPPYVPQDNPCGAYLHSFLWHRNTDAPCAFLNFEGVDSCFYVWLNGVYVGYSQVSHHTTEFDITHLLQEGDNTLAVLVLKWCDGSYLEDQDKFRFSGIFRDVYILNRPCERIEDYVIETDLSDDFRQAELRIRYRFGREPVPVRLTMSAPNGRGTVYQGTVSPTPERDIVIHVEDPVLWNAENPSLYTLVMETDGETITEQVGFRKIEVRDLVLTLNGTPIKFKGVNRHESDPVTGAFCGLEQVIRDLRMIKANNFNAVRTSHYPNVPWFYQICDALGLYVIDEADNESHGTAALYFQEDDYSERMRKAHVRIADNPDFIEPTLDRVRSMVIRNRNRPCILAWSMGNECGYGCTFEKALRWTKETDPTRLTHYESAYYLSRDREYDTSDIDLFGRMYPSYSEVTDYLDSEPDKPLLLVEYCHSMGNSPGDFKEYLDLTEGYPALCGGFVWEWCDHAIMKGTTPGGKAVYWYGGDHGELQHDSNFCLDGLVYPDRTPHTGLMESKNVHRPLRSTYDSDRKVLVVENHLDFTNAAGIIEAEYLLTLDGTIIACGKIALPYIAPHSSAYIPVSFITADAHCEDAENHRKPLAPDVTGEDRVKPLSFLIPDKGRCFLKVTYILKKEWCGLPIGHEIGFDEIRISTKEPRNLVAADILSVPKVEGKIKVGQEGRCLVLDGPCFRYELDTSSGLFTSLRYEDRELLDRPIDFNLWRAPTDNDAPIADRWRMERLDHTVTRAYSAVVEDMPENDDAKAMDAVVIFICQSVAAISVQPILRMGNRITVYPDGRILMSINADKDPEIENLPRIGMRLFLNGGMDQVCYYGMGPGETYVDKHHSGYHGYFKSAISSMHEDYIRPQENGSHFDCDYVTVSGNEVGMTVVCADEDPNRTFSFNVSVYTQEELETKRHNYELEPCGSTVLCIDHKMAGIGSKSCGPDLLSKYQVRDDHFQFAFMLKPEKIKAEK